MVTLLVSHSTRSFLSRSYIPFARAFLCFSIHYNSSQKMEQLTERLSALGVTTLPQISSAHPHHNPLDIFRSHIAERLVQLAPPEANLTPETVFSGLDRSTKPETGDFVLAIPRLRIKGPKPQELSVEWQTKVINPLLCFPGLPLVRCFAIDRRSCRCRNILTIFHL